VNQRTYHVLLEGRTVGPYERETIVGMRIKHMLTGDHLLVTSGGSQLTVRELIGASAGRDSLQDRDAPPSRSGPSRVQATYTGMLVERSGRGFDIPRFKGEIEVRVHSDVLRLAGRYRRAWRWKDGRIKLALQDIVHARAAGTRTDVWLQRAGSAKLQRLGLYMFTSDAAEELAAWLSARGSGQDDRAAAVACAAADGAQPISAKRVLAIVIAGVAVVIGLVLVALLGRRLY